MVLRLILFFLSISSFFFLNTLPGPKKSVFSDWPWKSSIEHYSCYLYRDWEIDFNIKDFIMLFTFSSFAVKSSVSLKIWRLLPSLSESYLLKAKKFDYLTDWRSLPKILSWELFFFSPSHPSMQQLIGFTVPLTLKAIKYEPAIMDMTASTKNDTIKRDEVTNEF